MQITLNRLFAGDMSFVISSFLPFPNIYWWLKVMDSGILHLDQAEHFQKMSYRNRYYISGANGLIQLSIPLANGRNQRCPMPEVGISNRENWQLQHWRTIVSVYNRTPYFSYYEQELEELFTNGFTLLSEFNLATVNWLQKQLKMNLDIQLQKEYVKHYPGGVTDLRGLKPGIERAAGAKAAYYQIFHDRTGFLPNLSMLDLLFSEGPHALSWMQENGDVIEEWGKF